jgi:hypothetical protein
LDFPFPWKVEVTLVGDFHGDEVKIDQHQQNLSGHFSLHTILPFILSLVLIPSNDQLHDMSSTGEEKKIALCVYNLY